MLSIEAVQEFQKICKEEHDVELTEGEARIRANQLIHLYDLIYRELPNKHKLTPLVDDLSLDDLAPRVL